MNNYIKIIQQTKLKFELETKSNSKIKHQL